MEHKHLGNIDFEALDEYMDALIAYPLPEIQEPVFQKLFLPLFTASAGTKVDIAAWTGVCGSPFTPVKVMKGKTLLFIVPPLLDDSDGALSQIKQVDIAEQVVATQQKFAALPQLATAHFRHWFTDRVGVGQVRKDYIKQWNVVFAYYGLPLLGEDETKKETTGIAAVASVLNFDDLQD